LRKKKNNPDANSEERGEGGTGQPVVDRVLNCGFFYNLESGRIPGVSCGSGVFRSTGRGKGSIDPPPRGEEGEKGKLCLGDMEGKSNSAKFFRDEQLKKIAHVGEEKNIDPR